MAIDPKPRASRSELDALLQRIALGCVLEDGSDPEAVQAVRVDLQKLSEELQGTVHHQRVLDALALLGTPGSEEELVGLSRLGDVLDALQVELSRGSVHADAPVQSSGVELSSAGPPQRSQSVPAAVSVAKQSAVPAAPLRDPEMVELFADFVAESFEGLDRADTILLQAEQGVTDAEQVNALFRVFHTIKGVSGFLSVAEVTRLAHVTEALLDQVRQGNLELSHEALDAVFESSATMRRTLEILRRTVPQGLPDPSDPALPALLARIERASSGKPRPASEAAVEPGNLGGRAEVDHASDTVVQPAINSLATEASIAEVVPQVNEAAAETTPNAGAAAGAKGEPARLRETVKVDLERVDSIVEMVGELIIVESMVVNAPEILGVSSAKLRNYLNQMTKISRDLQNAAMRMRMVPVSGVFRKMTRLVRDLSRKTGKLVQMVQVGEGTEMDRSMVERIEDPLVHMIRNAIDHAIELPDERRAAGKSPMATLELSACHEGGSIAIELKDDGRGLPREKILKRARERGVIPDSGETLSDQEVFSLIFIPGFSTASQVTEISGRGVGMDVVKRSVEDMRGRVLVDSTRGQGTTFKLILPLTLAIIDGMLVAVGDERYIVPSLAIIESLQPTRQMVHAVGDGTELISVRGEIMPLLRLGTLFGIEGPPRQAEESRCVILESAGRKLGLLVDDILTQQQVVIKPLGEGLGNIELLAGAAILPDGRVGLILNVDRLGGFSGKRRRATNDSGEVAA